MASAQEQPSGTPLAEGRYLLLEVLGEGGMATVYRARDARLQVPRAIKVLAPNLAGRRQLRERFEAEARTMAMFDHPNIVRVFDVGIDGDKVYIVMELVTGGSLLERVRDHGALPHRMALDVVIDVLRAISAAHERGIVHRDIKPHNILLTSSGQVRVTDFGIARLVEQEGEDELTRTGAVIGTWGFMAPEQKENAKAVDFRADIYSAGATLWAIVTNQTPNHLFAADIDPAMMAGLPENLADLIKRATRYRREDRFPDAATMIEEALLVRDQLPRPPADTPPLIIPGGTRRLTGVTGTDLPLATAPSSAGRPVTLIPDPTPPPATGQNRTLVAMDELDDTEPVTREARLAAEAAELAMRALKPDLDDAPQPPEPPPEPEAAAEPEDTERTAPRDTAGRRSAMAALYGAPSASAGVEAPLDGGEPRTDGSLPIKTWLMLAGAAAAVAFGMVMAIKMVSDRDPVPVAQANPTEVVPLTPPPSGPTVLDPSAQVAPAAPVEATAPTEPPPADPPATDPALTAVATTSTPPTEPAATTTTAPTTTATTTAAAATMTAPTTTAAATTTQSATTGGGAKSTGKATTTSSGSRKVATGTPTLTHRAVSRATAGQAVAITAKIEGTKLSYNDVTLSYRAAGATRWSQVPMGDDGGQKATVLSISGDLSKGFEYYIKAKSSQAGAPELSSGSFLQPHKVSVN